MKRAAQFLPILLGLLLCNCAVLHHVQLSDIDGSPEYVKVPIEVKVSEFGVSTQDIKSIANSTNSRAGKDAGDIATLVEYFQMGPRTGAPVYTDKYAEKIIYELHTQCPSGKLSGLVSIRESREYPVIKGEIIKITGYCLRPRS
jgi:hypothetical protein